jgi:hypothetical protein
VNLDYLNPVAILVFAIMFLTWGWVRAIRVELEAPPDVTTRLS